MPLIQQISKLRPALAEAAQKVIDGWVQDEEGFNEDLGSGGACDEVARALESVIGSAVDEVDILDGGQDGDDHAWLIVVDDAEAVGVDIHPSVYETGGGYSWKKRQDAHVSPEDVIIWPLNRRDIIAARTAAMRPNVGRLTSQDRDLWVPMLPARETASSYFVELDGRVVKFLKRSMTAAVDGVIWHLSEMRRDPTTDTSIDHPLVDPDPNFRAVLRLLNEMGAETHSSCSGHPDRPSTPYVSATVPPDILAAVEATGQVAQVRSDPAHAGSTFITFVPDVDWSRIADHLARSVRTGGTWATDDVAVWEIDRKDVASRIASRIAIKIPPKTVYLGQFSYLGRTYDVKVRDNGQAAVVYQKSPKCVFGKDENGWYFHGGSRAIYEAAVRHLDSLGVLSKTASGSSDKMRLQEGAGFHLQPDGTWEVKDVPPAVAQDARFSGFLAIEGYWCAVFELNGEEWAQKAGPGVGSGAGPVAARMADIARRVALSPEIHLS